MRCISSMSSFAFSCHVCLEKIFSIHTAKARSRKSTKLTCWCVSRLKQFSSPFPLPLCVPFWVSTAPH